MRNKNWLRYGLASAVVASGALGAVLVACGDDDSGVTAQPDAGNDTSTAGDTGGGDTGTPDTGTDATVTPKPANIVVVHGATSYGAGNPSGIVRVCYATKTASDPDFTISPLAPLPHSKDTDSQLPFPGIPIGTGGPFPSTGLPLEAISIRPYIISAQALAERGITGTTGVAATARCNRLLTTGFTPDGGFPGDAAATALAENTDYWKLADIPAGTFKNEKTYILSITGCTSDAIADTGKCGNQPGTADTLYTPTATPGVGNLQVAVLEIDATSTIATDEMGVQVVHISPQYHIGRVGSLGAVIRPFSPVFGNNAGDIADASTYDAASNVRVLGPDASAEIAFTGAGSVTAQAKLKGIVTASGYFAAHEDNPANNGPFIGIPMNNPGILNLDAGVVTIQYISEGKSTPSTTAAYTNGKAYTFVLVGDPDPALAASGNPLTRLRAIHFLAYPNVFTPPPAN